jgi:hypothetical protein
MAGTQCLITSVGAKLPGVVSGEGVTGKGMYASGKEATITGFKEAKDKGGWVGARRQGAGLPGVAKSVGEDLGWRVGVLLLQDREIPGGRGQRSSGGAGTIGEGGELCRTREQPGPGENMECDHRVRTNEIVHKASYTIRGGREEGMFSKRTKRGNKSEGR